MNLALKIIAWARDRRKFRYLRFVVGCTKGAGSPYVQFSRLDFADKDGAYFDYPAGTQVTISSGGPQAKEGPENIIDHSAYTKLCVASPAYPWTVTVDLGEGNVIDVRKFGHWEWWTANDYAERDPHRFALELSKDGAHWIRVDSSDIAVADTRYALAYRGEIDRTLLRRTSVGGGGQSMLIFSSRSYWPSRRSRAHSARWEAAA